MIDRVLSRWQPNQALLARQCLLAPSGLSIEEAIEQVGGLHARRSGILPDVHRPIVFSTKNPFSVGTVLLDGPVAAAWSVHGPRCTRAGRAVRATERLG